MDEAPGRKPCFDGLFSAFWEAWSLGVPAPKPRLHPLVKGSTSQGTASIRNPGSPGSIRISLCISRNVPMKFFGIAVSSIFV